jgi:5-formyltetrahydrofolate cyclo-ligase
VIVPIIERETRTLRLSYLTNPDVLITSTFNVPEPIGNEIPVSADTVEVAIIPLIAFDLHGNRLGYGAGYYDRFLTAHPVGSTCEPLSDDYLDLMVVAST